VQPGAGLYPAHPSVRRSPPAKRRERTKIKITFNTGGQSAAAALMPPVGRATQTTKPIAAEAAGAMVQPVRRFPHPSGIYFSKALSPLTFTFPATPTSVGEPHTL
jgi:hypothetical protein